MAYNCQLTVQTDKNIGMSRIEKIALWVRDTPLKWTKYYDSKNSNLLANQHVTMIKRNRSVEDGKAFADAEEKYQDVVPERRDQLCDEAVSDKEQNSLMGF
jgi:hypothetical protein